MMPFAPTETCCLGLSLVLLIQGLSLALLIQFSGWDTDGSEEVEGRNKVQRKLLQIRRKSFIQVRVLL